MRSLSIPFVVALLASTGCSSGGINTDPTIFVDAKVTNPTVAVEQKALGTAVTGGFTLSLHLGARAVGPSDVALQGFQLKSTDENTVVVDALPLAAKGQTFPITVDPGTDEDVDVVIDLGNDLLAKDIGQKLCNFGEVRYIGSITDSLRGGTIPVRTDPPVKVTGCAVP